MDIHIDSEQEVWFPLPHTYEPTILQTLFLFLHSLQSLIRFFLHHSCPRYLSMHLGYLQSRTQKVRTGHSHIRFLNMIVHMNQTCVLQSILSITLTTKRFWRTWLFRIRPANSSGRSSIHSLSPFSPPLNRSATLSYKHDSPLTSSIPQ